MWWREQEQGVVGRGGERVVGATASGLRGLPGHLVSCHVLVHVQAPESAHLSHHPHPWATLDIVIDFFEL